MLRRLAEVRARLVANVEALPPESLRDPSWEYTVVEWLPELAWTHEQGHLDDLKAWWKSEQAAGARNA
jgi:hypothetical protein